MGDLHIIFEAIKRHYRAVKPQIMACPSNEWAVGAYAWDYPGSGIQLTPIERNLWADIRQQDMVMYPQYPVGRFFVDFGNPVAKVAIECDGKAYHRDQTKDAERQRELESMGWTVYRISGADCNRDEEVTEDDEGREVIKSSPAWQFVRRIGQRHNVMRGRGKQAAPAATTAGVALLGWLEGIVNA